MSEDTSSGAAFIEAVNLEPTDGGPEFTQPESSESVVDTASLVKVDIVDLRDAEAANILESPFGPVPLDQVDVSHLEDGGYGQGVKDVGINEIGYDKRLLNGENADRPQLLILQEVSPDVFREAVLNAIEHSDLHAENLDVKDDYATYSCWLSEDGMSGVAISVGGEITNVFSMERGRGQTMMEQILSTVATAYESITLNCFDGFLPGFYRMLGFEEVERQPNADDRDGPDVVHMEFNRDM